MRLRQADHAEKESGVNSMAFIRRTAGGNGSRDGRGAVLLATGGEDGKLRVWELRTDSCEHSRNVLILACFFTVLSRFLQVYAELSSSHCPSRSWYKQRYRSSHKTVSSDDKGSESDRVGWPCVKTEGNENQRRVVQGWSNTTIRQLLVADDAWCVLSR